MSDDCNENNFKKYHPLNDRFMRNKLLVQETQNGWSFFCDPNSVK